MKRSYAILGVGGYYGAALARAGHPVHWLVRPNADRLRRDGICVEPRSETWRLPAPSVAARPTNYLAIRGATENHRFP